MRHDFDLNAKLKTFSSFEEASESILHTVGNFIDINTLFIAKNDKTTNKIVKVLNKDKVLVEKGSSLPFEESICKLSVDFGPEVLYIPNLSEHELTLSLEGAKGFENGCFIGIPIYYEDGENYGTICGLDSKSVPFTENHFELFKTMASFLAYALELEQAKLEIDNLSAPLVSISPGVAALPIIGSINEHRVDKITSYALFKCQELALDYLIIDLSGIIKIDTFVSATLLRIVKLLKLVGVTPILTGVRPDMALKAREVHVDLKNVIFEANLGRALTRIGFNFNQS
ncbi:STAS domain-containing protein [Aquibacillus kalidii]|uniref:STAS domain-containing protein n=1 Tax=Aquibacillus kalidii TaxID=2762597 RepID=UPI0016442126|nr:STAS domain-containing protein [Aquibacillus kalidii]